MKAILVLLPLVCGCAALQKPEMQKAMSVSRCLVEDERLGKVVTDQQAAKEWLAETHATIHRLKAEADAGGPYSSAELVELLADLADLLMRLEACVDSP